MKQIQMFIDSETKTKIQNAAINLDLSISQLMRKLISKKYNLNSIDLTTSNHGKLGEHFAFRVTDNQKNKLESEAKSNNISISEIVRELIKQFLEEI